LLAKMRRCFFRSCHSSSELLCGCTCRAWPPNSLKVLSSTASTTLQT
jgi:hypothetical protein